MLISYFTKECNRTKVNPDRNFINYEFLVISVFGSEAISPYDKGA